MKNISVNQLIIIFLVGVLLFSDFSKILKNIRNFIKNNEIYKTLKKK
jgi:Sec-independent protein translocase protein TatA